MAHRTAVAAVLAVALIAACSSRKPPGGAPEGLGRRVHDGAVRALAPSPDGKTLAFLDACEEVRNAQFLPPRTARCDLRVVRAEGGGEARIAAGVTTLPHGVAWRPDGKALVAMSDYDHSAAAATLVLWDGAAARHLGEGVTFHGYGASGELGFVAGGRLSVLLPGEAAPRAVAGAERVASFDISPTSARACGAEDQPLVRLVARRNQVAGGELLAAGCALDRVETLERAHVGDYGFSKAAPYLAYTAQEKDGAVLRVVQTSSSLVKTELGKGVRMFGVGPDGKTVAFVADAAPGKQGDLHLGGQGQKDRVLAREVGEFMWARGATRLAWLEKYDARIRAGSLGVGGIDLAPRAVAANVSELELGPDGKHVAFLQHTTRGGYSVDLGLAHLDPGAATTAATVATGVFGFAFSPDGAWLYYRTRCVRNAEACDLERIPAAGLPAGGAPERIADAVKSFEFDPRDPGRLLLGWQRADLVALDVGVWEQGRVTRVDTAVLPGSAQFLGPDSRRLAYVVVAPKREGVYVAELRGK